jgi:hypothetical protein
MTHSSDDFLFDLDFYISSRANFTTIAWVRNDAHLFPRIRGVERGYAAWETRVTNWLHTHRLAGVTSL